MTSSLEDNLQKESITSTKNMETNKTRRKHKHKHHQKNDSINSNNDENDKHSKLNVSIFCSNNKIIIFSFSTIVLFLSWPIFFFHKFIIRIIINFII